jgi:hypothetical protein
VNWSDTCLEQQAKAAFTSDDCRFSDSDIFKQDTNVWSAQAFLTDDQRAVHVVATRKLNE